MNAHAMDPFGSAVRAFFEGDAGAELTIHRDDGTSTPLPVSMFFRDPSAFSPIEHAALDRCKGHVLDIGAGSGLHSLALREKGMRVTSIDIHPSAVDIMKRRGLEDVRCANVFDLTDGSFDTLLMLGHGIGMVETLAGLDRFLSHARGLLRAGGQLLIDSLDVRVTDDPNNRAYLEANRRAGRYFGEIRVQFEFKGAKGPFCGWLHVDPDTLAERAATAGWQCETPHREARGDHLTRLSLRQQS